MTFINKIIAILMLPVSLLLILEGLRIFNLELSLDKVLIGSILIIILQILNMNNAKQHNSEVRPISALLAIVFIIPGLAYIISLFVNIGMYDWSTILGIMMLTEALYALH